MEGYHGTDAAYFLAGFVVPVEGKVENVQIVYGISEGFADEFTKQIPKTSRQWQPALLSYVPRHLIFENKQSRKCLIAKNNDP